MMGFVDMSKKRPRESGANEKGKCQKTSLPRTALFRLLCPTSKAGSLIGKGGCTISRIHQASGAKVRVGETIPRCNERIVFIATSDKDNRLLNSQSNNTDKQSVKGKKTQSERVTPSIQKGLFLVFDQLFQAESTKKGGGEDGCVVRLLVPSSQINCILGEAGNVIKKMASETGSTIVLLPKDELPACATSSDELIQLSGGINAVRRALQYVSQRLLDHPSAEDPQGVESAGPPGFPEFSQRRQTGFAGSHHAEITRTVVVVVPTSAVAEIYGDDGGVLKRIREFSEAKITIDDAVPEAEDTLITVSGIPNQTLAALSLIQCIVALHTTKFDRRTCFGMTKGPNFRLSSILNGTHFGMVPVSRTRYRHRYRYRYTFRFRDRHYIFWSGKSRYLENGAGTVPKWYHANP